MGINYCKQLGIKPSTTVSAKDFDKLWKKYDESKTGFLDKKAARKFLKHFAEAVGTPYDELKAQQLLRDVDPKGSGFITYEMFKKLFFEATHSIGGNRVGLTQSLQVKLSVKSTLWSKKAVLRTSNMSNANDEEKEQLPEEVDDEYFILDQPFVAECPFKIITEEELDKHMAEQEAEVSKILGIPVSDIGLLIRLFGWDKEKLYARYFDDPDGYQHKAGILVTDENPQTQHEDTHDCPVCCEEVPYDNTFALRCGHRYCNDCWQGHLKSMVSSYGGDMLISHCKCMTSGCHLLLNKESVTKLADADTAKRYRYFFNKTFVEVHKRFTYCPAQCGHVVMNTSEVELKPKDVVECVCSKKFCFHCGLEYHNPVKCKQMREWSKENASDQESLNLVMAIAKPCPNQDCGIAVDRTEGCNHMTCQKCGYEWCWQCRGPWKDHGERTGGFYFCNQYDNSPAAKMDEEAERLREEHNRFLHFFNGWHVNDKDEKGCLTTLKPQLLDTAAKYENQTGADTDFLFQALDTLIQSRHLVKHSYIYAYFLPNEDTPQKKMFETQQAYAQEICERLAKELMNPIESLDRNKIVYLNKACQRYISNLVDFFESDDGQALYASMPRNGKPTSKKPKDKKQQTAFWVCSKCTFGNDPSTTECTLCGASRNIV